MGLLPYGVSNSNSGACDTCSGHLSCLRLSFPSSGTWSYYLRMRGTFLSIFSSVVSSWFEQVHTLVWAVTTLHPDGAHSLFSMWGRWKAASLNLQVTHWFLSWEVGFFSQCCHGVSQGEQLLGGNVTNFPCLFDVPLVHLYFLGVLYSPNLLLELSKKQFGSFLSPWKSKILVVPISPFCCCPRMGISLVCVWV